MEMNTRCFDVIQAIILIQIQGKEEGSRENSNLTLEETPLYLLRLYQLNSAQYCLPPSPIVAKFLQLPFTQVSLRPWKVSPNTIDQKIALQYTLWFKPAMCDIKCYIECQWHKFHILSRVVVYRHPASVLPVISVLFLTGWGFFLLGVRGIVYTLFKYMCSVV